MAHFDEPTHPLPLYVVAFIAALFASAVAAAVAVMAVTAGPALAPGVLPFVTAAALVLWCWFFAERVRHYLTDQTVTLHAMIGRSHLDGYMDGYVDGAAGGPFRHKGPPQRS